jgi:hypothetical protein
VSWSTLIFKSDAIVTLSKWALLVHCFLLFGDEFEKRAWRNFIKALVVFHFSDMTGEEVNAPVGIGSCLTIKQINSQIYKKKNTSP